MGVEVGGSSSFSKVGAAGSSFLLALGFLDCSGFSVLDDGGVGLV